VNGTIAFLKGDGCRTRPCEELNSRFFPTLNHLSVSSDAQTGGTIASVARRLVPEIINKFFEKLAESAVE
jgi:hypothetical protein